MRLKGKYIILIVYILFYHSSNGQDIGLRANTEFSDNKKINNAFGFGGYVNINDFSKKIELLFSLDYNKNNKIFQDEDFRAKYTRFYFSTNCMYVFILSEKIKLKTGPSLSYNVLKASDEGIYVNWIHPYKTKAIGTGVVVNIQFHDLFNIPISFDIYFTPTYLINIKKDTDLISNTTGSDYSENLKILNLEFGLSYKLNNNNSTK